jgi:hypothetical protein
MLARQKKYALGFIFDQARDHHRRRLPEVFTLFSQVACYALQRTDEPLQILPHRTLPESRIMPNLAVLISLALDESGITEPVLLRDGIPVPNG